MKRLIPLLILAVIGSSPSVYADDEVTPLQLKVMQTRKFIKPAIEVAKAAKEDGEASGSRGCNISPMLTHNINPKVAKSGEVRCLFSPTFGTFGIKSGGISKIAYEISANLEDTETTLRLKIFTDWQEPKQVTDPEVYAKHFKRIGDLIFIEAIPLTPAVQN